MFSVGILSAGVKWPEILSDLLGASGSCVTGWIDPAEAGRQAVGELIERSDLVWIPEKLDGGMEEAIQVIRRSRHLSLGFPIVDFEEEAHTMVKLAHEARVLVQVGHHDWFRPLLRSALGHIHHPQSICFEEYVPPAPEGEDPRHLFNTMVADIDLALGLSGSTVRKVRSHASRHNDGTVIGMDIRMEMHNGAVVIFTIRKFSREPRRRLEIIQADGIIRLDLSNDEGTLERIGGDSANRIESERLWPPASEPGAPDSDRLTEQRVARECLGFIRSLERGRHPLSGLEGGFKALEMARHIHTVLHTF